MNFGKHVQTFIVPNVESKKLRRYFSLALSMNIRYDEGLIIFLKTYKYKHRKLFYLH